MFSTLLPEVISKYVFPFLGLNDLLRLRRVCKASRELTDDYLRVYGTSDRIVGIDVNNVTNENFLAPTYPLHPTRLDFNSEDNSSWAREEMLSFSRLYGDKITHLQIINLYIPLEPAAVQFFEGFSNLKELRIFLLKEKGYDNSPPESESESDVDSDEEQVDPPPVHRSPPESDSDSEDEQIAEVKAPALDPNLPSTLKRLKHLFIQNYYGCSQLLWAFLEECSTHLEYINQPPLNDSLPYGILDCVKRIVERRHRDNPDQPNLKYVDLYYFQDSLYSAVKVRSFYELVTTCSAHNVKFQNVDARVIEEMMKLDTPDRGLHGDKISRCVESIKNLTPSVFRLEMPVLEEIDISLTSWCSMPAGEFDALPWPNLKKLKLLVDAEPLATHGGGRVSVSRLFEFLFHEVRRENMESLHLLFTLDHMLPYPDMSRVCSSCPNLKKLHISDWPGTDRDIAQLWGNLPLLEDGTFGFSGYCWNLGDAAFIGTNVARPAILSATRLESLTLKGLNYMPGITDTLFKSAIRHMPLKYLYLRTDGLFSSITLAGLKSLLTGKFAKTIEKFPLKGEIRLEGATDEQLAELEGKFRSAQM